MLFAPVPRRFRLTLATFVALALALGLLFAPRAYAGATVSQGQVTLTWSPLADPSSSNDTDYQVLRGVNGATPSFYASRAKTSSDPVTWNDGGVTNGNSYTYKVVYYSLGAQVVVLDTTTVSVSLAAPSLTGSESLGVLSLSWNAVSDSTSNYWIYRGVNGATPSYYTQVGNSGHTYTDGSVSLGNTYAYYVRASNNAGQGTPSTTESVAMALAAPDLSVTMTATNPMLQWDGVPNSSSAYWIYRGTDGATPSYYAQAANSSRILIDGGAYSGHTYAYYVRASNSAGQGTPSNTLGAVGPADTAGNPGVPYQCACPRVGQNGADLVNMATGSEANEPPAELPAYNPTGPGAAFRRIWRANQAKRGYSSPGLPVGWVHDYDVTLQGPTAPTGWSDTLLLGYAMGANEVLTPVLSGGTPTGAFTTATGAPYLATGVAGSTPGVWQSVTLTWQGGGQWIFSRYASSQTYALTRINDRMGNGVALNYSSTTRALTTVKNAATNATLLTVNYDSQGLLASVTDAYSRKVTYTVGQTSGIGRYQLLAASQVVSSSTSNPPARYTYAYQGGPGTAAATQPYLASVTEPSPTGTGNATATIAYDSQGRVSTLTDATCRSRTFVYGSGTTTIEDRDSSNNLVFSYAQNWDSQRRNTGTTVTDGTTTSTTIIHYDDTANPRRPTSVELPDGKTWETTYDSFGNVLTTTTPRGVVTTRSYSYSAFALGRLTSVQEGTKAATSFTYFEPSGLVDTVTSPSPTGSGTVSTSHTYNSLGDILTITVPGNNAGTSATTTFSYTQDGTYTQSAALGQAVKVTDPAGRVSHARYDSQGRVSSAWDALGNTYTAQYNLADQPTSVTMPATGQTGTGSGSTQSTYLYTGGPVVAEKVYNEAATLFREVDYSYDAEGRTLSVTGSTEPVSFVYDGAGRILERYDGNNNLQSAYIYDGRGLLAAEQKPVGSITHERAYGYDSSGRVTQRVDRTVGTTTGQIVANYSYLDDDGLLTAIEYPDASSRDVSLEYDGYGRLSSRSDSTGTQEYSYGDLDQILSVTTTYTGLSAKSVSYSYYPDGSRDQLTTPAGTFSYLYNAAGDPTSLTNPQSETTSWSYQTNGALSSQTQANGITSSYTLNALSQLTSLLHKDASNTTITQFASITHDGAGNRLGVTATFPSLTALSGAISYSYDTKDRLTQESSALNGGFVSSFGYDDAGNPTTFKGSTRTFDAQNRRSGTGFAYDVQGNPTTYTGTSITYTPEGQATAIGSLLTADYTAEGLRAWKEDGATSTRTYFLYDGTTPVVELNASGSVTAVNTFGANGLISRWTAGGMSGTSVFYAFDERGNTARRFDATGTVLDSHAADSYGGTLDSPSGAGASDPFAGYGAQWGYYRDAETGLYLCTFRYYDPAEGRWLTPDPIGYAGGCNLYGYVGNRAPNAHDPLGLQTVDSVTNNFWRAINTGNLEEAILLAESGTVPPGRFVGFAAAILSRPQVQNAIRSAVGNLPKIKTNWNLRDCERFAYRAAEALEGFGARKVEIYRMVPRIGQNLPLKDGRFFNNGYHFIVRYGNRVIDSVSGPKGTSFKDWKELWQYGGKDFYESYRLINIPRPD
jgi:RHS repeat-associated protein